MSKQAIEGAQRSVLFTIDPMSVQLAGIDYECGPEDPTYNPRNYDPLDANLVDSIMRLGVLEPIGVVKTDDDKLRVVYGNQRIRSARAANELLKAAGKPEKEWIKVPCLSPLRGFNDKMISEVTIAENEQRRETSALAKAELASIHMRRCGGNVKEAAKAFGLSVAGFNALLTLNEASPEMKKAITEGKLSASAAIELAGVPKAQQQQAMDEVIAAGGTQEKARTKRKKAAGTQAKGKPTPTLVKEMLAKLKGTPLTDDEAFNKGFVTALKWVLAEPLTDRVTSQIEKALTAEDAAE